MLLSEVLQIIATGEDVEVYITDSHECFKPFNELMPKEWECYEVRHLYSIMNKSKDDTKTHIEVKEI